MGLVFLVCVWIANSNIISSSLPTDAKQTEFMLCVRQLSWNGNYVKYSF